MRIGIDAHILGKRKGGVETWIQCAIKYLAELDRKNRYFIYVSETSFLRQVDLPSNFQVCRLATSNRWLERALVIPYVYARDRLDVLHVQRALPFWGCPNSVLHVHDATYVTNADLFPRIRSAVFDYLFRRSCRKASVVLTGSLTSRADVIRCYGLDPAKIALAADAVDTSLFHPVEDRTGIERTLAALGIGPRYVLFLGSIERNKNIHVLIDAFERFRHTCPGYRLAIVGTPRNETRGGYLEELKRQVARLSLEQEVVFTGYVSEQDRLNLLNGTDLLVFPSIAEGFGLPPLEAMACGRPALVADTAVNRELYENAVLMAEPNNPGSLAESMVRLVSDPDLVEHYRQKGFEKVAAFSWKTTCEILIRIYEGVAARKPVSEICAAVPTC